MHPKEVCRLTARQVEMARARHESEEAPGLPALNDNNLTGNAVPQGSSVTGPNAFAAAIGRLYVSKAAGSCFSKRALTVIAAI